MTGDDHAVAITQRELLLELRADIRAMSDKLDAVVREQAVGGERRVAMQAKVAQVDARLDAHDAAIDELRRWRDEAAGAIRLARWALGASLLASILMVVQIASAIAHAVDPTLP